MIVYVFPGQGSQRVGMGRELLDTFPNLVEQASEVLGYSLRELCLEDPKQQLSETAFTQPAVYTINALAYMKQQQETGRSPDMVAGHSLGEYDALYAAGVFDFLTGLQLVAKRGALMSKVSGCMAAVIGQTPRQVGRVLASSSLDGLDIANFNSYEQTVIAGPKLQIDQAALLFQSAGARQFVTLDVSAPFHSRYMRVVEQGFEEYLNDFTFAPPRLPVISNYLAVPYRPNGISQTLARQISSPVRWIESVEHMFREGASEIIEIGVGHVLTSLIRQIGTSSAFDTQSLA